MFKYMILLVILILFVSCSEDEKNNTDIEKKDPCKTFTCQNGKCLIDIGNNEPYCKCNEGYEFKDIHTCIKEGENNLCENIQCPQNSSCKDGICVCDEGYEKINDECKQKTTDPCENKECGENQICNGENGECICIEGYTMQDGTCQKEEEEIHAVMIYGDNRDHELEVAGQPVKIDSKHPRVVSAMMREINSNPANIKYIFNSGDLVWDGNDPENEEWDDFFSEIKPFINAGITYYPVLGNHEHNSPIYFDRFELPENERYYHVDLYNIRFLALDSNSDLTEGSEQRNWLIDKLDNLPPNIKFVVAIYHHPTFSTGHHGDDGDKENLREILHPLFVEKGVDIVFNGHDHAYEHLVADGINYFVTGGGGAILDQTRLSVGDYEYSKKFEGQKYHYCLLTIKGDTIKIEAKEANSENSVFDTVTINSKR